MATIQALLNQSEVALRVADAANEGELFFEKYIQLSEAASLLAIARCLNHIVDHGIPKYNPANVVLSRLQNAPSDKEE